MFKRVQCNEPSVKDCNFLTIVIHETGSYIYSFSNFNNECEWENKFGEVVAFTEEDPKVIFDNIPYDFSKFTDEDIFD